MEKTLGEERVRVNFNVSIGETRTTIDEIKVKSAELIDIVEALRQPDNIGSKERGRLIALAQTAYEQAAMWAVKAATV